MTAPVRAALTHARQGHDGPLLQERRRRMQPGPRLPDDRDIGQTVENQSGLRPTSWGRPETAVRQEVPERRSPAQP